MNLRSILLIGLIGSICLSSPAYAQSAQDDKDVFLVAQKAFEDGFYDVAIRYIEQLMNNFPQTEKRAEAQLLLGQCYFFKSQYLKAFETFEALKDNTKFQDGTLYWLGETYLKGSDYTNANDYYQQLIKLYPDSIYTPQAHYSMGWAYFEQGKFEEAKSSFAQLRQNFPNHQLGEDAAFKIGESEYNLKDYDTTIDYFKSFVTKYPDSTRHAQAYFYIAECYYYLENYLDAITYYKKTSEITFDSKLSLLAKVSLGWSYLKIKRFDQSQEFFSQALKFAQEKDILTDDVYLGQANLYSEIENHEEAIEAYSNLIEAFPNSSRIAEAHLGKANVYYKIKDYKNAIIAYQDVIEKFKDNLLFKEMVEKAYFGKAWSYLKDGNIDESVKNFENIKNLTTSNTVKISALTQIGDAYQDVEQYNKAIEIYDTIQNDYPDSPYTDYVQYRLGIALLRLNKLEAATIAFQHLEKNFPKSRYLKDINYYLAVASYKRADWRLAKDYISEFIKDIKDQKSFFLGEAHYILALSEFNLGNFGKAQKIYNMIIRNYPDQIDLTKKVEINIAKCFYELKDTKEALKRFKLLNKKYPNSEVSQEAVVWLGNHYLSTEEYDTAIVYYIQFLNDYPKSDKIDAIRYELAQAYQGKNELDKAINLFNQISPRDHKELFAKAQMAIAQIFSSDSKNEAAVETYEKIIQSSPEYQRDALVKIGDLEKRNGQHEKAIKAYERAMSSEHSLAGISNAQLQFNIADAYELLNDKDAAIEHYLKIVYLYPDELSWITKSYLRTARMFEDQEKWLEAQKIYFKVIDLKTDEMKFAQERLDWIQENIM